MPPRRRTPPRLITRGVGALLSHHRQNATLKELSTLVAEGNEAARQKGCVFNFAKVFRDARCVAARLARFRLAAARSAWR